MPYDDLLLRGLIKQSNSQLRHLLAQLLHLAGLQGVFVDADVLLPSAEVGRAEQWLPRPSSAVGLHLRHGVGEEKVSGDDFEFHLLQAHVIDLDHVQPALRNTRAAPSADCRIC